MACTDENPCKQPVLRWVHSRRCQELTERPKTNDSEFRLYSDDALRTAGEGDLLETSKIIDELRERKDLEELDMTQVRKLIDELVVACGHDEHKVGIMYDALGLAGEAGEIADYVKKWVGHGKVFDLDHVEKELGDVLWYVNRMTRRLGKTLRGVAMTNIAKLKARYPQGFSHEASENRKE